MMDCEMCGGNANAIALVEGVQMHVCERCAAYGKVLRSIALPQKERPRPVPRPIPASDLIESVHPDVAKLLREHRERLGLKQEDFARKMNLRASVYQHYETGKTVPDIVTARRLEHELKTPLVVKIKVQGEVRHEEGGRSLTLGDFMKKRK